MRALAVILALLASDAGTAESRTAPRSTRAGEMGELFRAAKTDSAAAGRLIERVAAEKDPLLHKYAVGALVREKMALSREQKRAVRSLARDAGRGALPSAFPRPGKGPIEVRHYIGPEFYEREVQDLTAQGFTVTGKTGQTAEATRGRLHVVVRSQPENFLTDVKDPKVSAILYSGHSNIGGVIEQALAKSDLGTQRGTKLIAALQCKGTQVLPLLKSRLPLAHVITTYRSSYEGADVQVLHSVLTGLEKGWSYKRIRNDARRNKNYIYPDQVATLGQVDMDRNGVLDSGERFNFSGQSRAERRVAERLLSGVHFAHVMTRYYQSSTRGTVYSRELARAPIVSGGIAKDTTGDGVVQLSSTKVGEAMGLKVSLNEKFAQADPAFVAAAAVYEIEMHLQKQQLGQTGKREQARALTFAADYLKHMYTSPQKAERGMTALTTHLGLPAARWDRVSNAIIASQSIAESAVDNIAALYHAQ